MKAIVPKQDIKITESKTGLKFTNFFLKVKELDPVDGAKDLVHDIKCQVSGDKLSYLESNFDKEIDLDHENLQALKDVYDPNFKVFKIKLAVDRKAGGGGGAPRGFKGQKLSLKKYLETDAKISIEFMNQIDSRQKGREFEQKLTQGEVEELIRARASQYWIMFSNNVVGVD